MSTTGENHTDSTSRPSPAPSATGSTGTSGITVRSGPNGQMSFRRQRASRACEVCLFVLMRSTRPVKASAPRHIAALLDGPYHTIYPSGNPGDGSITQPR
ncbi:hypothetical protein BDV33DRAFT_78684 [Aspergillus novoparasiticus]|uniref:Uncharacterized protein n=1 Tax=Aspergillus novoparasiticus TaxID=986946 RepID=A0A5N6F8E0_9EURO|nr:hypothetical protein BDV33DRAFT_78684 [Aspergillus novoparasiticus]